jgi:hypothetical protein
VNVQDLLLRATAIVRRRRVEEELDEELRSHLELQTRKHVDAGLSPEEAERQARIDFGVVELTKDNCRDARRVNVESAHAAVQSYRFTIRDGGESGAFL